MSGLVFYSFIRLVIEEEVISEQAGCYQETDTTDERTSVTEREKEWIEKGESYANRCVPFRTDVQIKSLITGFENLVLTSVFHASVLLLIINFVITISKKLWSRVDPQDYFDN